MLDGGVESIGAKQDCCVRGQRECAHGDAGLAGTQRIRDSALHYRRTASNQGPAIRSPSDYCETFVHRDLVELRVRSCIEASVANINQPNPVCADRPECHDRGTLHPATSTPRGVEFEVDATKRVDQPRCGIWHGWRGRARQLAETIACRARRQPVTR